MKKEDKWKKIIEKVRKEKIRVENKIVYDTIK